MQGAWSMVHGGEGMGGVRPPGAKETPGRPLLDAPPCAPHE